MAVRPVASAAVTALFGSLIVRGALQLGAICLRTVAFILAAPLDRDVKKDPLTRMQREQIRMTAWRLQNAFEELINPRNPDALRSALKSLSFLAETFGDQIIAWTEVMDELVDEAERHYGTAAGQGAYKRAQVKGIILTIVRRESVELPGIPMFLQPVIFAYAAEVLADFVVAHLNDNALWDFDSLPRQSPWHVRLTGRVFYYMDALLEPIGRFLTSLAWRIVMLSVRLSPRMRRSADRLRLNVAGSFDALRTIARFAAENPSCVRAAARVFSIATQQAEMFVGMSGPQKQAYAHDLILAFLEQNGLVAQSGLWREIVSGWLRRGIDATVALYNRRGLFVSTSGREDKTERDRAFAPSGT